jgi:hypothetical protein
MSKALQQSKAKSQLPAGLSNMSAALRQSAKQTGTGSDPYLKCAKGEWIYGADDTEVEEDSLWAVNPLSFEHGWVAWGSKERKNEGVNVGEIMVPAVQPLPDELALPEVNGDWSKSISFQLSCVSGEDEGTQVLYKANSHGAKKAYAVILELIVDKIDAGDSEIVPIVLLETDSYKHATYGKIHTPILEVKKWITLEANTIAEEEGEEEEEESEEETPKPKAKRESAAAKKARLAEEEAQKEWEEEYEDEKAEAQKVRKRAKRETAADKAIRLEAEEAEAEEAEEEEEQEQPKTRRRRAKA